MLKMGTSVLFVLVLVFVGGLGQATNSSTSPPPPATTDGANAATASVTTLPPTTAETTAQNDHDTTTTKNLHEITSTQESATTQNRQQVTTTLQQETTTAPNTQDSTSTESRPTQKIITTTTQSPQQSSTAAITDTSSKGGPITSSPNTMISDKVSSLHANGGGTTSATFYTTVEAKDSVAELEGRIQGLVAGCVVLGILLFFAIVSSLAVLLYLYRRLQNCEHVIKNNEQVIADLQHDLQQLRQEIKSQSPRRKLPSIQVNGQPRNGDLVNLEKGTVLYRKSKASTSDDVQTTDRNFNEKSRRDDPPPTNPSQQVNRRDKSNKKSAENKRPRTNMTYSAIFGHAAVDIFSDIADTSHLLPICHSYFTDDSSPQPVRESIIEKVVIQPLGLDGGLVNGSYRNDANRQRPTSYIKSKSMSRHSEIEDVFGNYSQARNSTLVDEVFRLDSSRELIKNSSSDESDDDGGSNFIELSNLTDTTMLSSVPPFPNAADYNQGMFVRRTIGLSGGQIELMGVVLDVPVGAVSSSKEICLGILWQNEIFPRLSPKQTLLSPIIVCEPHSLRFDKPVRLMVPHCAQDVRHNWDVTLLKSETTTNQVANWKPLTLEDYAERVINDEHIIVSLYHFTLYTCIGEGKGSACAAKCVNMVAFAAPLEPGKFFKVRVYCTNFYTEFKQEEKELEKVRYGEAEIGGKRLNVASRLIVRDNGQNLCAILDKLSQGWVSDCDKLEIDFETMWHSFTPSCEFVIRPVEQMETLSCLVKTFQDGRPEKASVITIAEQAKSSLTGLQPLTMFPSDLCNFLVIHLDASNPLRRDWHAIAEHMNLDMTTIAWIEQRQPSPTEFLLGQWEKQKRTLEEFCHLMKNVDRQDILCEVEKYLRQEDAIEIKV